MKLTFPDKPILPIKIRDEDIKIDSCHHTIPNAHSEVKIRLIHLPTAITVSGTGVKKYKLLDTLKEELRQKVIKWSER